MKPEAHGLEARLTALERGAAAASEERAALRRIVERLQSSSLRDNEIVQRALDLSVEANRAAMDAVSIVRNLYVFRPSEAAEAATPDEPPPHKPTE